METKRMSASERETMLRVVTAMNILITEPEQLKARMKDVPYYSRDVGMLRKKALTLIEKMTDTIPKEQMWQWYREVKSVTYTVGVPGVTSRANEKYGTTSSTHCWRVARNSASCAIWTRASAERVRSKRLWMPFPMTSRTKWTEIARTTHSFEEREMTYVHSE